MSQFNWEEKTWICCLTNPRVSFSKKKNFATCSFKMHSFIHSFILFLLNKLDLCIRCCKETLQSFNPCEWIRLNETDKEAFVSYLGFCPVWWSWSRGGNKPRCISLTWFPFSYAHLKRKQTHTHTVWWHREKYSGLQSKILPLSDSSQILPLFFFSFQQFFPWISLGGLV